MTTYTLVKISPEVAKTVRTAQVQQLIEICAEHDGKTFDASTISPCLEPIVTKQDKYLIFKYYQKQLVALGAVVVNKMSTVAEKVKFFAPDTAHWEMAGGDYSSME